MTTTWSVVSGSGDDDDLPSEEREQGRRRHESPDNEVPVPVLVATPLGRTPDVAVLLTSVQAHTTGFSFSVGVRLRHAPPRHRDVYEQVSGGSASPDALLLGVQFADGRRASTVPRRHDRQPGRQSVVLHGGGGGGGSRHFDHSYWVSPLPPEGPLLFVVRWEARGLGETTTEVDGGLIAAAGRASEELWPWEAEEPVTMSAPEPLALPADSWFAQ